MSDKIRLDVLLHDRGLVESREKARAVIMAGEVTVNGDRIDKPGTKVAFDATVVLKTKPRFVSRGGDKLAAALMAFSVPVEGASVPMSGQAPGGSPIVCFSTVHQGSTQLM